MAYPPAAVESATTAHVPDLTGAFEAYSTTSLLLACARIPLVIIPTIHAMFLKYRLYALLGCLVFPCSSPLICAILYLIEFVRLSEVVPLYYFCPTILG